jgi:hypothetical protein
VARVIKTLDTDIRGEYNLRKRYWTWEVSEADAIHSAEMCGLSGLCWLFYFSAWGVEQAHSSHLRRPGYRIYMALGAVGLCHMSVCALTVYEYVLGVWNIVVMGISQLGW